MNNTAPPTDPGTTPGTESAPPGTGPRVTPEQMRDLGRLRRSTTDRHIAGVAGGLARHLDIDPILVRVAFVVGAFFGGAGLFAYFAAWLFVPEEGSDAKPMGLDERSRVIAFVGACVLALLIVVGGWSDGLWFIWPVAIISLAVAWFIRRQHQSDTPSPAAPWPATSSAPATAAPMPPVDYTRLPPLNPRKRGPILFGFTLALIALGLGTLGVIDVAGAPIVASAYPALALGITTVMLLVGAFWGRAGGLIALGLVSALALAISMASTTWRSEPITHAPTSAAQVQDTYDLGAGELVVDLTRVRDLDQLDGRDIGVDVGVGRVEVLVPAGVSVEATADAGLGEVTLFERNTSGPGIRLWHRQDGRVDSPEITLAIDLGVGEIIVREVR